MYSAANVRISFGTSLFQCLHGNAAFELTFVELRSGAFPSDFSHGKFADDRTFLFWRAEIDAVSS